MSFEGPPGKPEQDVVKCPHCGGGGKDSKSEKCKPCNGTGFSMASVAQPLKTQPLIGDVM